MTANAGGTGCTPPAAALNLAEAMLAPALDGGHAERPALLSDAGAQSYRELEAAAARHASAMRATGAGRGDRVVLSLPDGPELVAAFLGALAAGAVPVVVSTRLEAAALAFVLTDSAARLLLVEGEQLAGQPGLARPASLAATVALGAVPDGAVAYGRWLAGHGGPLAVEPTAADDMAYWLYTSGTTGRPKAVVHRHRDAHVADLHLTRNLGLVPGERIFTTSKLFFAYALGHSLIGGLRAAATVVLHRPWPDAGAVAGVIARTRPHLVFSVPTLYRRLLDAGHGTAPAFREVRHFVSAGEPLPRALGEQWRAASGKPILEGIGTTETVWLFVANTPHAHRAGTTGRLLPWADARLVGDDGEPVTEPDRPGVLWVRMGSMFAGYWNQPERTRAVLDGDWYCTDDVFVRDAEGWLHHRGRRGDRVKISGQWVSIADVEQAAFDLPELEEAAAVAGEGDDGLARIVLFAVPRRGAGPGLEQRVAAQMRERLPHHQCPREVRLIAAIPRTATGKVKRFELRESL